MRSVPRVRQCLPVAAFAVLLLLGTAGPAAAAFPGKPGPIAYSKTESTEVGGEVRTTGGLLVHGPRAKQPARRLTTVVGDHSPSYSANGRLMVFVNNGGDGGIGGDLFVMRSDGTERRQLTSGSAGDTDPSFFPNGRRIVFSRSVGPDNHIYSIALDGTGLLQLTSGHHDDIDPVVSPNGRRIVFVSDRDEDERGDRGDIFTMLPDGSGLRVLIDGPLYDKEPDYAPSGRRIAFVSNEGPGFANIFLARADGSRVKQLTPCRPFPARCRSHSHPSFSPDGRHIAMLGSGGRGAELEVMRTDAALEPKIFDSAGVEEEGFGSILGPPAWGPHP